MSIEEDKNENSLLQLSVSELRERVRSLPNSSYTGAEISIANKETLVVWLTVTSTEEV